LRFFLVFLLEVFLLFFGGFPIVRRAWAASNSEVVYLVVFTLGILDLLAILSGGLLRLRCLLGLAGLLRLRCLLGLAGLLRLLLGLAGLLLGLSGGLLGLLLGLSGSLAILTLGFRHLH